MSYEQEYQKGAITKTASGEIRRSKFEANVELQLKGLGLNPEYEATELTYESSYVPDFKILIGDRTIYLECKGYFTPEDRSKMLKVKQKNPSLDIRMVFMADNKLNAKSNMRYSDWCNKHGFPFAIKNIPLSWTL